MRGPKAFLERFGLGWVRGLGLPSQLFEESVHQEVGGDGRAPRIVHRRRAVVAIIVVPGGLNLGPRSFWSIW